MGYRACKGLSLVEYQLVMVSVFYPSRSKQSSFRREIKVP